MSFLNWCVYDENFDSNSMAAAHLPACVPNERSHGCSVFSLVVYETKSWSKIFDTLDVVLTSLAETHLIEVLR